MSWHPRVPGFGIGLGGLSPFDIHSYRSRDRAPPEFFCGLGLLLFRDFAKGFPGSPASWIFPANLAPVRILSDRGSYGDVPAGRSSGHPNRTAGSPFSDLARDRGIGGYQLYWLGFFCLLSG